MTPCVPGWFGRPRAHRFEARYDSEIPRGLEVKSASVDALEALRKRTYIGDICTRCGEWRKREGEGK